MEKDIGRIEVTSRGVLNQLISIQETLNQYLPGIPGIIERFYEYFRYFAGLMNTTEQILATLKEIQKGGLSLAQFFPVPKYPEGQAPSMPGSDKPGDGNEEVVEDTTQSFKSLSKTIDRFSDAASGVTTFLDRIAYPVLKDGVEIIADSGNSLAATIEDIAENVSDSAGVMTWELGRAATSMRNAVEDTVLPIMGSFTVLAENMEAQLEAQLAALDKMGGSVAELNRKRADLEAQLASVRGTKSGSSGGGGVSGGIGPAGSRTSSWGAPGLAGTVDGVTWGVTNTPINLNVTVNNADAQQVANRMISTWRARGVDI